MATTTRIAASGKKIGGHHSTKIMTNFLSCNKTKAKKEFRQAYAKSVSSEFAD